MIAYILLLHVLAIIGLARVLRAAVKASRRGAASLGRALARLEPGIDTTTLARFARKGRTS